MANRQSITKEMLPDGWTIHPFDQPGAVVLKAPGGRGFVTIHLQVRAWAFGIPKDRLRLKHEPSLEPKGRGWLRELVKEATTEFLASPSQA